MRRFLGLRDFGDEDESSASGGGRGGCGSDCGGGWDGGLGAEVCDWERRGRRSRARRYDRHDGGEAGDGGIFGGAAGEFSCIDARNRRPEGTSGRGDDFGAAREGDRLSRLRREGSGERREVGEGFDLSRFFDDEAGDGGRDDDFVRAGEVAADPIRLRNLFRSSNT